MLEDLGCYLGQDVHYVTPMDAGVNAGAHRAAKIVKVNDDDTVNLIVFKGHLREGETADSESTTFFAESRMYCPKMSPGTFHLPSDMLGESAHREIAAAGFAGADGHRIAALLAFVKAHPELLSLLLNLK